MTMYFACAGWATTCGVYMFFGAALLGKIYRKHPVLAIILYLMGLAGCVVITFAWLNL